MGDVKVLLFREEGGTWEGDWELLRETSWADLFPVLPKEVVEQAMIGDTKPFVNQIGRPPEGSLRKIPQEGRQCAMRKTCRLYAKAECAPLAKRMPTCYSPDGLPEEASQIAHEAIRLWREGVYVVAVRES